MATLETLAPSSSPSLPSPRQLIEQYQFETERHDVNFLTTPNDTKATVTCETGLVKSHVSITLSASAVRSSRSVIVPAKSVPASAKTSDECVPVFRKPQALEDLTNALPEEINGFAPKQKPLLPNDDVLPPKKRRRSQGTKRTGPKQAIIGKSKLKKHAYSSANEPDGSKGLAKRRASGPKEPEALLSEAVAKKKKAKEQKEKHADLPSNVVATHASEQACQRRLSWTPARDTVCGEQPACAKALDGSDGLCEPNASPSKDRFGSLVGAFGFDNMHFAVPKLNSTRGVPMAEHPKKKRRIELVNGSNQENLPPPKAKRSVSPKKPRTITGKVTAAFAPKDGTEHKMTQYLNTTASVLEAGNGTKIDGKPRPKKAPTKGKQTKAPACTKPDVILLSPMSGMKNARAQPVLFGTSSQLAREDSPETMLQIQRAIRESESACVQKDDDSHRRAIHAPQRSRVLGFAVSKGLWSASSRAVDALQMGKSVTPTVEALDESEAAASIPDTFHISSGLVEPSDPIEENGWHVLDDTPKPRAKAASIAATTDRGIDADAQKTYEVGSQEQSSALSSLVANNTSPVVNKDGMPNFRGFMDHELDRVLKRYHLKTIKKREDKISQLEKCWEGEQKLALRDMPTNTLIPKSGVAHSSAIPENMSTPPKKKRGRPRKMEASVTTKDPKPKKPPPKTKGTAKTAAKAEKKAEKPPETLDGANDEIYDSSPPTPSPPRRRTPTKPTKQLPLSPSSQAMTAAADADMTTSTTTTATNDVHSIRDPKSIRRSQLLESITKAITTLPATNNIKSPSWYEKILMYDPIVIEDLTSWLNREGLPRVDEDLEADIMVVKEWCEGRSICCLWGDNLRGGARGRW